MVSLLVHSTSWAPHSQIEWKCSIDAKELSIGSIRGEDLSPATSGFQIMNLILLQKSTHQAEWGHPKRTSQALFGWSASPRHGSACYLNLDAPCSPSALTAKSQKMVLTQNSRVWVSDPHWYVRAHRNRNQKTFWTFIKSSELVCQAHENNITAFFTWYCHLRMEVN